MKELLEKIQLVSDKCKAIEKDMVVGKGQNSYKAVSDHSVILKVKEAEKEAGIISIPIKQELINSQVVRFNKKAYNSNEIEEKINYVDDIKMTLRIYDVLSEKFIDVESYGKGIDPADKGFGKASTYARKYALLNAYKIATGEDPDANKSEQETVLSLQEKNVIVSDYFEKNNIYKIEVLKHFGVQETKELTNKQFDSVYKNLLKKKLI